MEPGKDNIKKSVKNETRKKQRRNKQARQDKLKSAISNHCKGANYIVDWEGTRPVWWIMEAIEIWKWAHGT